MVFDLGFHEIRSRSPVVLIDHAAEHFALPDARTRVAAQMVMLGYDYADAGAAVGLSADAVEGRLYRLRRRPR